VAPGYFPAGRMVSVALSRLTSTLVFRRNAQLAAIHRRLCEWVLTDRLLTSKIGTEIGPAHRHRRTLLQGLA
jgi:hypothetical protein